MPNYTARDNWQKLVLINKGTGKIYLPVAPANKYLHSEDLRIFKDIDWAIFLSPPWKGTVIGTATPSHPATTKGGTIMMNQYLYNDFLLADCEGKKNIAKEYGISIFYTPELNCPGFVLRDWEISSEGFSFYFYNYTLE